MCWLLEQNKIRKWSGEFTYSQLLPSSGGRDGALTQHFYWPAPRRWHVRKWNLFPLARQVEVKTNDRFIYSIVLESIMGQHRVQQN